MRGLVDNKQNIGCLGNICWPDFNNPVMFIERLTPSCMYPVVNQGDNLGSGLGKWAGTKDWILEEWNFFLPFLFFLSFISYTRVCVYIFLIIRPYPPLLSLTPSPSRWTPSSSQQAIPFLLRSFVCMCVLVGAACMNTGWGSLLEQGQQHHQEMRPSPQAGFLQGLLSPWRLKQCCWFRWNLGSTWPPQRFSQVSVCLTPAIFICTPAAVPRSVVTEQASTDWELKSAFLCKQRLSGALSSCSDS